MLPPCPVLSHFVYETANRQHITGRGELKRMPVSVTHVTLCGCNLDAVNKLLSCTPSLETCTFSDGILTGTSIVDMVTPLSTKLHTLNLGQIPRDTNWENLWHHGSIRQLTRVFSINDPPPLQQLKHMESYAVNHRLHDHLTVLDDKIHLFLTDTMDRPCTCRHLKTRTIRGSFD